MVCAEVVLKGSVSPLQHVSVDFHRSHMNFSAVSLFKFFLSQSIPVEAVTDQMFQLGIKNLYIDIGTRFKFSPARWLERQI